MNWEAIGSVGEIVGAIAVVTTLIYFSIQIRNLKADSYADSITRVDEGLRELHKLNLEHAELLVKAADHQDLTNEELFILNEIFLSNQDFHFFSFLRAQSYGRSGLVQVRNYARYLTSFPFLQDNFLASEIRTSPAPAAQEFARLVEAEMAEDDT